MMAFMPLGIEADAPRGFVAMCQRERAACGTQTRGASPVTLAALQPESVDAVVTPRAQLNWTRLSPALTWSLAVPPPTALFPVSTVPVFPPTTMSGYLTPAPAPALATSALALPSWLPALEIAGREASGAVAGLPEWVTPPAAAVAVPPPASPIATPIVAAAARPRQDANPLKLLRHINRKVNGRVRQRADDRAIAGGDSWQETGKARWATGDCEDIALQKRRELLDAGFTAQHLFLAVAFVRGIGLHTVLVGRTEKGDFVLDSMTPYVTHWSKVGYSWLRIQSGDNPMDWRTLGRSTPVQLAALSVGRVPGTAR